MVIYMYRSTGFDEYKCTGTEFDQVKGYVPWKRGVALVKVKILCRVIKVLKQLYNKYNMYL